MDIHVLEEKKEISQEINQGNALSGPLRQSLERLALFECPKMR
ncbi:hypothetical protein D920_02110 [Enterococcus faecalis 13-SD-W-01]|nr:hypothetical protein D920_02110 [Enterococcus faecalis 13-SD-W-01]